MWNMKCMIIPVITGATGVVTKDLRKYLNAIPRKHSVDSLKKRQLYLEQHTYYGQYCNLNLEACDKRQQQQQQQQQHNNNNKKKKKKKTKTKKKKKKKKTTKKKKKKKKKSGQ